MDVSVWGPHMKVLKEWSFKKLTGQWQHAYGIWRNPGTVQESGKAGQRCHPATAGRKDHRLWQELIVQTCSGFCCRPGGKSSKARVDVLVLLAGLVWSILLTMKEVKQWQAADLHKTKVIASQRAPLWFIALLHHILVGSPIGFKAHLRFLWRSQNNHQSQRNTKTCQKTYEGLTDLLSFLHAVVRKQNHLVLWGFRCYAMCIRPPRSHKGEISQWGISHKRQVLVLVAGPPLFSIPHVHFQQLKTASKCSTSSP